MSDTPLYEVLTVGTRGRQVTSDSRVVISADAELSELVFGVPPGSYRTTYERRH